MKKEKNKIIAIRGGQQAHASISTNGICPTICTFIGSRPEVVIEIKNEEKYSFKEMQK